MIHSYSVSEILNCDAQRAYEAPMFGDATRFLTGYLTQPPVIGFEEDDTWPMQGGTRKPVIEKNWIFKKGVICMDEILEKRDFTYWKWTVYDFTTKNMFFTTSGVGEWTVETLKVNQHKVIYTYSYTARNIICAPLNWLFVKIQVRGLMHIAMKGIKLQAESGEELYYKKKRSK